MQRLDKSLAQKTAPKGPEWPSYGNLSKVTQNRHFLNKYKRGTKRNFSKIAQKVGRLQGHKKYPGENRIISQLVFPWYSLKVQTSENILLRNAAPKVPGKPSYDKFGKDT